MTRLPIVIIADNIRSLYNVGSLFRIADGVNLEAIYLCGLSGYPKITHDQRPDWVSKRADKELRKTGLAGIDSVDFKHFDTTELAISELRARDYQIVALEKSMHSVDYRLVDYNFPLALIV